MTEVLGTKTLYKGWTTLSIARVRGPDGRQFDRLIEDHGSAACILPYDPERKTAILVSQFRAPVCATTGGSEFREAIAGLTDGEDPARAAAREAFEETGLKLDDVECLATVWTMPGLSTERMSLCLARYSPSDRVGRGGGHDHENENITVIEVALSELARMADEGTLDDLKTLALVQALRLRQPELFA